MSQYSVGYQFPFEERTLNFFPEEQAAKYATIRQQIEELIIHYKKSIEDCTSNTMDLRVYNYLKMIAYYTNIEIIVVGESPYNEYLLPPFASAFAFDSIHCVGFPPSAQVLCQFFADKNSDETKKINFLIANNYIMLEEGVIFVNSRPIVSSNLTENIRMDSISANMLRELLIVYSSCGISKLSIIKMGNVAETTVDYAIDSIPVVTRRKLGLRTFKTLHPSSIARSCKVDHNDQYNVLAEYYLQPLYAEWRNCIGYNKERYAIRKFPQIHRQYPKYVLSKLATEEVRNIVLNKFKQIEIRSSVLAFFHKVKIMGDNSRQYNNNSGKYGKGSEIPKTSEEMMSYAHKMLDNATKIARSMYTQMSEVIEREKMLYSQLIGQNLHNEAQLLNKHLQTVEEVSQRYIKFNATFTALVKDAVSDKMPFGPQSGRVAPLVSILLTPEGQRNVAEEQARRQQMSNNQQYSQQVSHNQYNTNQHSVSVPNTNQFNVSQQAYSAQYQQQNPTMNQMNYYNQPIQQQQQYSQQPIQPPPQNYTVNQHVYNPQQQQQQTMNGYQQMNTVPQQNVILQQTHSIQQSQQPVQITSQYNSPNNQLNTTNAVVGPVYNNPGLNANVTSIPPNASVLYNEVKAVDKSFNYDPDDPDSMSAVYSSASIVNNNTFNMFQ